LALVYGLPIRIDTASGMGVAEVFARMSRFLDGFSRWRLRDPAIGEADMRQEAYAAAMEGMRAYRHGRSAQLSTFLHRHVLNRMIDLGRSQQPIRIGMAHMAEPQGIGPEEAVDLARSIDRLGERWGRVVRRILVDGERVADVAGDERMSPWGLTRALRRRLRCAGAPKVIVVANAHA
jgi:DNA-directed RNA polymerase specialized sigma24 family protein